MCNDDDDDGDGVIRRAANVFIEKILVCLDAGCNSVNVDLLRAYGMHAGGLEVCGAAGILANTTDRAWSAGS